MMRITSVVLAVLALCLAVSSSAFGTTGHVFLDNFGAAGPGAAGGFTYPGPGGLAVRQSNGDVYIADPFSVDSVSAAAAPRIERFDATGVFQSEFAIDASSYSAPGALAIGPTGGGDVLYVGAAQATGTGTAGVVLRYSAAGVAGVPLVPGPGTTFVNPVALAVDSGDGTVYASGVVTAGGARVIEKFDSTGAFQASFDGSNGAPGGAALSGVSSLAVDGAHRLLVSDGHKVYRYSAAGAYELTLDDLTSIGINSGPVAADPATDRVYVVEGQSRIAVLTSGGVKEDTFSTVAYSSTVGMDVNASTGVVYTSDGNNAVAGARYAAFTGPTPLATTGASIDPVSETLNGTVNPNGIAGTTAHFEYGPDVNYGQVTADIDPGNGNAAVAVSDTANVGLLPNSTYHFRVVATNPGGTIHGPDATFTTAPGPPVVDGAPPFANPIRATGATLNGTVDPRGSDTTYRFDYGLDTSYGSSTTDAGPLSGQGAQGASSPVTGLAPNTTYHFRVVADNGTGGPQVGADQTFITGPATASAATSITAIKATLTGVVNPRGGAASYHFEYSAAGTTTTTPEVDVSFINADTTVTATSGTLRPGTVYTVRTVVTDPNTGITTSGAEGTFTTDPAPIATTGAVTGVTPNAAAFTGGYDTHGHSGSYQFIIGSSTSAYLAKTDPVAVSGAGTASGVWDNLPAGQTYHVRLAVRGEEGVTTLGDAVTFSTPAKPTVPPVPPKAPASGNPYGCTAPVLAAYNAHPKAGEAITITGSDLGVGGNATLGTASLIPSAWSASGFTITVPDDATGSLPLTVNCGVVSNTIAIQLYQAPSNTFNATVKAGKAASTVTVSVKVPGPGSVTVTGANVKTASKHAGAAGTSTVKAALTAKAVRSLKRHHKLTVAVSVRFTPTGGTSKTITKSVTFTRNSGH